MGYLTYLYGKRPQIIQRALLCLIAVFGVSVLGSSMSALAQDATPAATPAATPSAAPIGQIAFSTNRDGNFEVYIMNADGSDPQRLTNNTVPDFATVWSPDGTQLLFNSTRDGKSEIYVMNADGSNVRRLVSTSAHNAAPAWSPDGKSLAFSSDRDGNFEIYVMDADGSNVRRLTHNPLLDSSPVWTPDGQIIFLAQQSKTKSILEEMNADGSNLHPYTAIHGVSNIVPTWSPDWRQLAFALSQSSTSLDIFVANADGSNQRQITHDLGFAFSPSWSPDGKQITFMAQKNNLNDVYVINADGSNLRRLTTDSAHGQSPLWRPDPAISAPLLAAATEAPAATSQAQQVSTATVNGHGSVNMRSGAGSNNSVVAGVPGGSTVTVLGFNADHSWVNVRLDNGSEGWVSASLLTINSP